VRHHREDQHRKGEDEIAELSVQGSVLWSGRRKVKRPREPSQSGAPLDLAHLGSYVSRLRETAAFTPTSIIEVAVPRIKSAKKRMRQSKANAAQNRTQRSQLRTALKKVRTAAAGAEAQAAYQDAVKLVDRAGRKRLIHPNEAARHKSRLARLAKAPAK
jgi:small subunit ribosomal protein S20